MDTKRYGDWQIWLASGCIIALSILIHFGVASAEVGQHVVFMLLGLVLAGVVSQLDLEPLLSLRWYAYGLAVGLLILTLVLGTASRGSVRWIRIGGLSVQPSEVAKVLMIGTAAAWLTQPRINRVKVQLSVFARFAIPVGLVFVQPDLGSALAFSMILVGMVLLSTIPAKHLVMYCLVMVIALPFGYASLKEYQRQRLSTFINPQADPLGTGYNVTQALIAIGSGQMVGRGLGHGTQSQLRFLPEHETDFIFAALSEELGFVGSALLLGLYAWLLWRMSVVASQQASMPLFLVAIGVLSHFAAQVIINIGMNLSLLPVTGITLPLVSSGGTSIVVSLLMIGMMQSLSRRGIRNSQIEITGRNQ